MLSVFITPWTKPTRIQCRIMSTVVREISNQAARTAGDDGSPRCGKSVRIVKSTVAAASRRPCGRRNLEDREADEGGGHAADDGPRFPLRVAVVEHVPHHLLAGGEDEAQGSSWSGRRGGAWPRCRGRFLADGGPEDGEAVGVAGVGGFSGL